MNDLTYVKPTRRRKKPGPTARYRAQRKRADDAVRLAIRAKVEARELGQCRLWQFGGCSGVLEHAHLGDKRRARTRGMLPELRHTTAGSALFCKTHHDLYDAGKLTLVMFPDLGANGPIRVQQGERIRVVQ